MRSQDLGTRTGRPPRKGSKQSRVHGRARARRGTNPRTARSTDARTQPTRPASSLCGRPSPPIVLRQSQTQISLGAACNTRSQRQHEHRMPAHRRSAVAGTTALFVCAVSSVSAYTVSPFLRASRSSGVLRGVQTHAGRRVLSTARTSMIYTPPRVDENDAVAVANLKRSLDRLVEMPSAAHDDEPVRMSPCPSLYGNWRPTSGTSSIQETTRRGKAARVSKMMKTTNDEEIEGARKKGRGRPPTIIKSAVKENMLPEFVERASEVLQQNGGSMDSNLFGQHWKQVHPNNPITSYKSVKGVTIHQMLRENLRFFEVSDTTRHKVKFFQLKPEAVTEYLQECKAREAQIKSSALVDKMAQAVRGAVESIDADAGQDSLLSVSVTADNAKKEHDVVSGALELAEGDSARPTDADADMVVHDYVPMQGKARLSSGFDRRRRAPTTINKEKKSLEAFREELPQAPTADDRDAVANPTVELYNSWAMDGRDVVMEVTHAAAFEEMWEHVTQEKLHPKHQFTAIDAGCGNGWAARKIAEHPLCESVIGIDAAAVMVDRAQHLSPAGDDVKISYSIGNVAEWAPEEEVDLVNLCESLYMFEDPQAALDNIVPKWLKPGGLLVANLDCYWENKLSHAWEEDLGVKMHCLSEKDWEAMFQAAGLTDVKRWRSKSNGPWQGTLLITGQRKQ